jgi:hypothetical protein
MFWKAAEMWVLGIIAPVTVIVFYQNYHVFSGCYRNFTVGKIRGREIAWRWGVGQGFLCVGGLSASEG